MARPKGGWKVTRSTVLGLYAQGLSFSQVGEKVGISAASVQYHVTRAGITRTVGEATRLRRHLADSTLVPSAFSFEPLTPDTAWLLGLIFGDGHIDKSGWNFNVVSGDRDILENIQKIMGGRLRITNRLGANYGVIRACSARLVDELRKYRMPSNKSAVLTFPEIPKVVLSHFVRGLVDSDGCFCMVGGRKRRYLRFAYYSMAAGFVESLRLVIASVLGHAVTSKLHVVTATGVRGLIIGERDAIKFGQWVYDCSSPSNRCSRKHAIWMTAATRQGIPVS